MGYTISVHEMVNKTLINEDVEMATITTWDILLNTYRSYIDICIDRGRKQQGFRYQMVDELFRSKWQSTWVPSSSWWEQAERIGESFTYFQRKPQIYHQRQPQASQADPFLYQHNAQSQMLGCRYLLKPRSHNLQFWKLVYPKHFDVFWLRTSWPQPGGNMLQLKCSCILNWRTITRSANGNTTKDMEVLIPLLANAMHLYPVDHASCPQALQGVNQKHLVRRLTPVNFIVDIYKWSVRRGFRRR